MNPDSYGFMLALPLFGLIGLHMLVRPEPVVRMFEKMAANSNDALSASSRRIFDPSRAKENARTFRLVGAMWLLLVGVIAALLYLNR